MSRGVGRGIISTVGRRGILEGPLIGRLVPCAAPGALPLRSCVAILQQLNDCSLHPHARAAAAAYVCRSLGPPSPRPTAAASRLPPRPGRSACRNNSLSEGTYGMPQSLQRSASLNPTRGQVWGHCSSPRPCSWLNPEPLGAAWASMVGHPTRLASACRALPPPSSGPPCSAWWRPSVRRTRVQSACTTALRRATTIRLTRAAAEPGGCPGSAGGGVLLMVGWRDAGGSHVSPLTARLTHPRVSLSAFLLLGIPAFCCFAMCKLP